jgi:hypothetical protein
MSIMDKLELLTQDLEQVDLNDYVTQNLSSTESNCVLAMQQHFTFSRLFLGGLAEKLGVVAVTPFVLMSNKVLILTPNTFVNDYVASYIVDYHLRHRLVKDVHHPLRVHNMERCQFSDDASDVVVVKALNLYEDWRCRIPDPSEFDLVVLYEAQCWLIKSWIRAIDYFPNAKIMILVENNFPTKMDFCETSPE